ncbi:hypothetical protein J2Y55_002154 [Bosea sp. BE125]|nr:hypothetical protein [Bosea sp. BE125]
MSYSLNDFKELLKNFNGELNDADGEPLSCQLYESSNSDPVLNSNHEEIHGLVDHNPVACNIADIIASISRILALPRSNVACNELSAVLIVMLDLLRENIMAAVRFSGNIPYEPTRDDDNIRRWAGFIKHPKECVFAHRCFDDIPSISALNPIVVDSDFLSNWDTLNSKQKDREKSEMARHLVVTKLPDTEQIIRFFRSCANHIQRLIGASCHGSC